MGPPDFDRKPIFVMGTGVWWTGYGMFDEWPSACFRIWHFANED